MRSVLILLAVLSGTAVANAQTKQIILKNATPGTYLLEIIVGEDGKLTINPLEMGEDVAVVDLNPDLPPPSNDRVDALRKLVPADGQEIGDTLSGVYAELANQVRGGELSGGQVIAFAARLVADRVTEDDPEAWKPFRDALGEYFNDLYRRQAPDEDYAKLLDDASEAAGNAANIDIDTILKLIEWIIKLLKELDIFDKLDDPNAVLRAMNASHEPLVFDLRLAS